MLSLKAFRWTHFQCVFMFLCVCRRVRRCVRISVCSVYPTPQQEINWLLISGHPGTEEMTVLLKMCQTLQVVDSEARQTELNRQHGLCLRHHHFWVSTFKIIDTFFPSLFLYVNVFAGQTDVIWLPTRAGMMSAIQGKMSTAASLHCSPLWNRAVGCCQMEKLLSLPWISLYLCLYFFSPTAALSKIL